MSSAKDIQMRIPQVTGTPGQKKVDVSNQLPKGEISEFKQILEEQSYLKKAQGLGLSAHAAKRLNERNIDFNTEEYLKVKDAMEKVGQKGARNSLVVTEKAAYIVDVQNNKVITAVDKDSMSENIFTKIDSTIFVN